MRRLLAGIIIGLVLGFLLPSPVEGAPKSCVGKGARSCQTPTPVLTTTVTQTPTSTPTETVISTPTPTPTSSVRQCPPTNWNVVYTPVPEQGRSKWCAGRGFTVSLVDATTSPYWHSFIAQAAMDWSASTVLDVELTVSPDASCSRPGGDGTRALVKVCSFYDDSTAEPSDERCNSVGCTSVFILPPECCNPVGVYLRDAVVWLNDWWIDPQRWRLDIEHDLIQQTVCHEIGHTLPLEHYNPGAYPDFQSCVFNHGSVPGQSLATLEQVYP